MKFTPLKKQSKREQKVFYARARGSWNGLCPVTRVLPDGKAYVRSRNKRTLRQEQRTGE